MKQKKKMFYALIALIGAGSVFAGMAAANYSANGAYNQSAAGLANMKAPPAYSNSLKMVPATQAARPLAAQPTVGDVSMYYNTSTDRVVYENAPVYEGAYVGVPQENRAIPEVAVNPKDGSLFGGRPCKNCSKDGSLFGGGPCKSCSKDGSLFPGPCKKCAQRRENPVVAVTPVPQPMPIQTPLIQNYIPYTPVVYQAMQRDCCMMAPIALDHVDFRMKNNGTSGLYSSKLGNYRFRIFGCRRFSKEANLNSGRIMEKNINFATVFDEVVSDCYKVLPMPKDLCLQTVPTELPEYVLTAEITDYFMNVCDEYDWDNAKKSDVRNGTSEMTVTWRLMDLTRTTVYWKGESTGYGELQQGETNGEVKLIERAFADAVSNLRGLTGFDDQLMTRVDPVTLAAQRNALVEEERALNPMKCGYRKQYECAKSCEISRPGVDISQCQPMCGCQVPVEPQAVIETCIDENGNIKADGNCQVVDDTWVDTGDVTVLENLCVVTTDPCKALTPETVYRMRSSVVQITSPNGRKGAGLLISDQFVLTSGDLIDPNNNTYKIKTVRNEELTARAIRVNPSKNTALLMLDHSIPYTPLALNLNLPEVGRTGFLTLGLLDVEDFKDGENYLDNSARIEGYRYTEEKGAEILANTFVQNVTIGGALIYKDCTINGVAHSGVKTDDGLDAFIPTEIALRSLGVCICGHEYVEESPWQQTVYKPVTEQIQVVQEAPEVMKPKERK